MIAVTGTLDLENRRMIFEFIKSRPGTFTREMERELGIQVGVLTYHLRILVEAGMVRSEEEGNHLRYFPANDFVMGDRKVLSFLRNRPSRIILLYVLDRGEISFSELHSLLAISKSTLSYHLKRLSEAGIIIVHKSGGTTVTTVDPRKLINMLVWVEGDIRKDSADALIDVWNRLQGKDR
jgi:predicted transcriptional regulator